MGRLRAHGGQEGVHGRRPDPDRRPEPEQHRDRLVQTVRNDIAGQWAAQSRPV